MKIDSIFGNIPALRNIKLDTILFESRYPVLFTCKNSEDVYLFICCTVNSDIIKWIGTKTSYGVLIELLEDKITIRDAFLDITDEKLVIEYDGQNVICNKLKRDDIPETLLPTIGEYMDADEGEYAEEIAIFRLRDTNKEHVISPFVNSWLTFKFNANSVALPDDYFTDDYQDILRSGFSYGIIPKLTVALA